MMGLNGAAVFVIQVFGGLYLLLVVLRFILQLVRADFYNPLCQVAVRATQPLLRPLRKVIPSVGGIDTASLLLAIVVQLIVMSLTLLLTYGVVGNPLQMLIWAVIGVAALFLKVFFFAMILMVIVSWVAPNSHNPAAELANQLCEPMLAPLRRIIPTMGGLDLSPIVAFVIIQLLDTFVIGYLAQMTLMPAVISRLI
ncbi:YggT family protein [Pseudomonas typographi]|uniref:YggT family protein n=1 Tax=Pseudomonas typographi TaxID=2715964 RepID=A0ABR7YZF3_9PSED|nr:YggT family protein [Pseudomonas typographi]MBD1549940.1 YggT family protein [Pseudomonas typographi]MBD1585321.1 YggT family protein [Pseudomonas typographi]MBD1598565.1 YggT family protein [Pseudomonas typographi]